MKNKFSLRILALKGLLLLMMLSLSACGPKATPTSVISYISTQVAATLQAQATLDMAETLVARMTQQAIPTATFTPLPTATPTLLPTATEKTLIEGNIFYDPQTKEDFKNVVLAPSPIDKPEEFSKWQDKYLEMVMEKLENYEGPYIEMTNGFFVDTGNEIFGFKSNVWPVIASYKFIWHGEEILNKTYSFRDKNGNVFPITITYNSKDSFTSPVSEYHPYEYSTPLPSDPKAGSLWAFYRFSGERYELDKKLGLLDREKFQIDFIGSDELKQETDEQSDIYWILWNKVWRGASNAEDVLQLIKTRFVFANFFE